MPMFRWHRSVDVDLSVPGGSLTPKVLRVAVDRALASTLRSRATVTWSGDEAAFDSGGSMRGTLRLRPRGRRARIKITLDDGRFARSATLAILFVFGPIVWITGLGSPVSAALLLLGMWTWVVPGNLLLAYVQTSFWMTRAIRTEVARLRLGLASGARDPVQRATEAGRGSRVRTPGPRGGTD